MAQTVTCTNVIKAGGKVRIQFGKTEMEFDSAAAVHAYIADSLGVDVLRAILMAKWLQADPTAATPSLIVGHSVTADLAQANNVVRVA